MTVSLGMAPKETDTGRKPAQFQPVLGVAYVAVSMVPSREPVELNRCRRTVKFGRAVNDPVGVDAHSVTSPLPLSTEVAGML